MKQEKRISAVCLSIIGLGAVTSSVSSITGIVLPDFVGGLMGIVDLAAAPVLAYNMFKIAANQPNKK